MVMVAGGGGAVPQRRDPEEEYLERQIERYAGRTPSALPVPAQQTAGPVQTLQRMDPVTAVMDSIWRVGGPQRYSQLVSMYGNYWRAIFNSAPSPEVVLDFARVPANPRAGREVLDDVAQSHGLYRGAQNPGDNVPFLESLRRGAMKLWGGTWAEETRKDLDALYGITDTWQFSIPYEFIAPPKTGNVFLPPERVVPIPYRQELWGIYIPNPAWEANILAKQDSDARRMQKAWEAANKKDYWGSVGLWMNASNPFLGPLNLARYAIKHRDELETRAKAIGGGPFGLGIAAGETLSASWLSAVGGVAQAVGWVGSGASKYVLKPAGEAVAQPAVASYGYIYATSPQFRAFVDTVEPGVMLIGDIAKENAAAVGKTLMLPVKATGKAFELLTDVESAALFGTYYLYKYGFQNQNVVDAMMGPLPGHVSMMPPGGPGDKEWDDWHDAQTMPIYEYVVKKTAEEIRAGNMFGTQALKYAGLPVDQMPMTSFMVDMGFYMAMDFAIGGGVKSVGRAAKIPELVDFTLRKTPWVQEIGDTVAKTSSPEKIRLLTGIWDSRALQDLAAANTREQVNVALRKWIVQGGGKVNPAELALERQVKAALLASPKFNKLPRIVQMAFSVMSDSVPGLRLDDARIGDSVQSVGHALGLDSDRIFYYADEAIKAKWRENRFAILDRMFAEGISRNPELFRNGTQPIDDLKAKLKSMLDLMAAGPDDAAARIALKSEVLQWTKDMNIPINKVDGYVDNLVSAADDESLRVAVMGMIEDAKSVPTDEYLRAVQYDLAKMAKGKDIPQGRAFGPHPWQAGEEMSLRDQQTRLLRVRQQMDKTRTTLEELRVRQQLTSQIRTTTLSQRRVMERLSQETRSINEQLADARRQIGRLQKGPTEAEINARVREILDSDYTDDIAQWIAENRGIDELDLLAYDSRIRESIPNWSILVRRGVIREAPKSKKKLAEEATISWAKGDESVRSGLDEIAERMGKAEEGHPEWGIGVDPAQANPTDELIAWLQDYVGVKERRVNYKIRATDEIREEYANDLKLAQDLEAELGPRLEALSTDPEAGRKLLEQDILSGLQQQKISDTIRDYQQVVAGFEDDLARARAELDELDEMFAIDGPTGERRIFARAEEMAAADREYDQLIVEFISHEGGIKPDPAHWDDVLGDIENQRNYRNLANPQAQRTLTEMADAVNSTFPAYGIKTPDDLWEFLKGNKKPDPRLYIDLAYDSLVEERTFFKYAAQRKYLSDRIVRAELTIQQHQNQYAPAIEELGNRLLQHFEAEKILARADEVLTDYEPFRRTIEQGLDLLDSGRIIPEPEVAELELRLAGYESMYRKMVNNPTGTVSVPLHPYQTTQYWAPDIPLETLYTHMGGSRLMRGLDEISAGFIKHGDKFMYLGWLAPDKIMGLWKKYALGSVGILTRIAFDEPLRMLSLGYGPDAVLAPLGVSKAQRALIAGDILIGEQAYADQLVETSLRWLMEEVSPVTHITFTPQMAGYNKAFSHTVHTIQQQATTQAWLRNGTEGLRRWASSPEGQHFLERRGTTVDEWVEQIDEYLFQLTHVPVTERSAVPGGLVTAAQQEEYNRFVSDWYDWFDDTLRPPVLLDKHVGELHPDNYTRDPLAVVHLLPDYDQQTIRQYVEYSIEAGEPPVLWHATVDMDGVRREGLRTQMESGMVGLGGTPDWVSVTYSESFAETAAQRMRIQTFAAKDLISHDQILDMMDRDLGLLDNPYAVAEAFDLIDTSDMPITTYIGNLDDEDAWNLVLDTLERRYPGPEGKHALVADIDSYYLQQASTFTETPEDLGVGMLRSFEDTLKTDENKIGVVRVAVRREPERGVQHIPAEFELRFKPDDIWVAEHPYGVDRTVVDAQFYEGMRRKDRVKLENLRDKQVGRLTGKRPSGKATKQYRYPFKAWVGKAEDGGEQVRVLGPAGDDLVIVEHLDGARETISATGLYRRGAKAPIVVERPPLRPRTEMPLSAEARAGAPVPPSWIDPSIEEVRNGRLYRRHDSLHFMLRGDMPINDRTINHIPPHMRPIIQGRRPKGALVNGEGFMDPDVVTKNPISRAYDAMYGMFDGMMKNVRTTIFAREYKLEREALERSRVIAARDGAVITDDELHVLAREHAQRMVDKITYNATRTGLEYAMRDIVPFAPATRDFLGFWGREIMRRPSRALVYARTQSMPSEVTVEMEAGTANALAQLLAAGGVGAFGGAMIARRAGARGAMVGLGVAGAALEGMAFAMNSKHPRQMVFNPRTATFFTGGAGAEGYEGMSAWNFINTNFPGVSPLLTVPAGQLANAFPEKFGPWPAVHIPEFTLTEAMSNIPGFELAAKELPLSSRTERLAYAMSGLFAAAGTRIISSIQEGSWSKGKSDWTGVSLPWLFGRNPEARQRTLDMAIRYMGGTGEYDIDNPDERIAAEETARLYSDASKEVWKREFWAGITGEFLPTIFYLRDAEQHDFEQATNAYRRQLYLPPLGEDVDPRKYGAREMAIAQRERDALREAYPEYEAAFDWMDAREAGDQEAMLAAGMKSPEVVGQLLSLYDASEHLSAISDDSLEQWIYERGHGLHPVKNPNAYAQEVADKYRRKAAWEETARLLTQFEKQMAADGFSPNSQEWKLGRQQIINEQKSKWGLENPQSVYTQMGGTDIAVMENIEASAEERWKDERARILKAEMLDKTADLKDSDPMKKYIEGQYRRLFEDEGLSWPGGEPRSQFEIEMDEIEVFVSQDPWGMTQSEAKAHGINWTPELEQTMGLALEARQEVDTWLSENHTSFWSSKAADIRTQYRDYIQKIAAGSPDFAKAWSYYTTPKWERLRDSGELSGSTWEKWFDALAQRDEWIDGVALEKTGEPNSGYFSMTEPNATTQGFYDALWQYAEQLSRQDPAWAEQFNAFTPSFWNKERMW